MEDKIEEILTDIKTIFEQSEDLKRMQKIKNDILSDRDLMAKISKLQELANNPYAESYRNLRKELFANEKIKAYKQEENDLYYFSLEISELLKPLLNERKHCQ